MGLGARQHLIHGEGPVEAFDIDPLLLVHQFLLDHGDLGDGSAPGQAPEVQEAAEDLGVGLMGDHGCIMAWRETALISKLRSNPVASS